MSDLAEKVAELRQRVPERTTNAWEALRALADAGERGLTDPQLAEVMQVDYPTAVLARQALDADGWLEPTFQIRGRATVRRITAAGARAWKETIR